MACYDDNYVEKNWKEWEEDEWYENICDWCDGTFCLGALSALFRKAVRFVLHVFCLCLVDVPKWSWKVLHHASMALCSFVLVLLAIISFASFSQIQQQAQTAAAQTGSGSCILFASYRSDHVELNTDHQTCSFAIGGEVVTFLGALALLVWFWAKARLGVGSSLDSVWLNLLQLLLLILLLVIAASCAAIMTAGLNHTCESHVPAASAGEPVQASGDYSGELIDQPCDALYFEVGTYDPPVKFYPKVSTAFITAWIGVVVLLLMLTATVVSFVGYQCRKNQTIIPNM